MAGGQGHLAQQLKGPASLRALDLWIAADLMPKWILFAWILLI